MPITPFYFRYIIDEKFEETASLDDTWKFIDNFDIKFSYRANYFLQRRIPFIILVKDNKVLPLEKEDERLDFRTELLNPKVKVEKPKIWRQIQDLFFKKY